MKVLIETYRGFEIYFDTEDETFLFSSDDHTRTVEKRSYASIKKQVDDIIKENSTFVPFEVVRNPFEHGGLNQRERIRVVGIRKDGRFVIDGKKKGEFEQLSTYNEKNWIKDIPENQPIFLQIASLEFEIEGLRKKIREQKDKLVIVTLEDLKPKYLPK